MNSNFNQYLNLIFYKIYVDLRAEAARTYIGVFWWLLEPLLYMAVFYIVFGILMQRGGEDFVPFLLTGMVAWKWFDSSIRQASESIVANHGLIQQVYLPKLLFPLITLLVLTIKFLLVMIIFLIFMLIYGYEISTLWLAIPLIMLIQQLLIAAIAFPLAAALPFFPDLRVLIANGLMLLLFVSGIFFKVEEIPERYHDLFFLNPVAVIVEAYRSVLLYDNWPNWHQLASLSAVSLIVLFRSYIQIMKN